jgi:RNA polymerase sigma-70 factor (ECF subfamily)
MYMEQDEATLLARLSTNLDAAFEGLMTDYWPQLLAFVLRRTTRHQDAEDILAEAWMRAYFALKGYSSERVRALKLRAWLYKITYHEYCRYMGRSTSQTVSLELLPGEPHREQAADQEQEPDSLFESAERRAMLEALVAALPERYREAVSLYYFEEFSYQEVADLLDQPLGTIKSAIHRGIGLLRKGMDRQSNEVY